MWYSHTVLKPTFRIVTALPAKPKMHKKHDEPTIGWVTITYRSVFVAILLLLMVAGGVMYFLFPKQTQSLMDMATSQINSLVGTQSSGNKNTKPAGEQRASFTMLDGSVKVKKKDSNSWVSADYALPLEKGDVVQTGPEGMAKIVFADQTNYTVKQDSLIVIEENSTNLDQQTHVAVEVTTGTVDLATATYSEGSKSQVTVAGATATLQPESAAEVRNDPRADDHEIVVKKGGGEVLRNGESVTLGSYEKVSFKADSPHMAKTREIGPPTLIDPSNMAPIFAQGGNAQVKFSWTPVDGVHTFHVRVSKSPYFKQLVMDKKIAGTDTQVSGMPEGAYYWSVMSIDDKGHESMESERNRFTIIPKNTDSGIALELDNFIQHGRIIEVSGKTDPSARVMVNGGEVPAINSDGTFRYLTPPLPDGENVITVTAQNSRGGVATQTRRVIIQ